MLWHWLEEIVVIGCEDWGWLLHVEGRHRTVKHREVDGHWHRSTTLSFMAGMWSAWVQVRAKSEVVILEHAHMWMMWSGKVYRRLRCRACDPHRGRNWSRLSHGVEIVGVVPVLEGLQRNKLSKLTAEDFWVTAKMMRQDLRCLLILRKITTLVEASRSRRIHEEIGWTIELDDEPARSWR